MSDDAKTKTLSEELDELLASDDTPKAVSLLLRYLRQIDRRLQQLAKTK